MWPEMIRVVPIRTEFPTRVCSWTRHIFLQIDSPMTPVKQAKKGTLCSSSFSLLVLHSQISFHVGALLLSV